MFRKSFDADKERSEELGVQRVYDQIVSSLTTQEEIFLQKIQEILATGSSIQMAIEKVVYPYIQKTDIYQKTISAPATLDEAISRYEDMLIEKIKITQKPSTLDLKNEFTDEWWEFTQEESEKFDIYTKSHLLKNLDDYPIQLPSKSEISPQQRNDLQTIITDLKEMVSDKRIDYRNILLDFFQKTSAIQNLSIEDIDSTVEDIMKTYHIDGEYNTIHLRDCLIRAKKIFQKNKNTKK